MSALGSRWHRRALTVALAAVTLLTSVGALARAAEAGRTAPDRPLRAATYNIHHGVGLDNLLDLGRIAREIEGSGAEVIGLQEVDRHWSERSDFVDQANWLAERLDMHVVYGANLDREPFEPGQPRRQYGTAILSRYKIRAWHNTLLPRPEGGEQRGLLEALIRVRGVDVRVFNTHLQHNSQTERLAQIAAIRQIVADTRESVILVGDLNALPGSTEISNISEDLVDTWEAAGEGAGYTYDAATPHARIDYVMSSSDVIARSAVVLSTDGSDHLPVVVDVLLPGYRVGSRERAQMEPTTQDTRRP